MQIYCHGNQNADPNGPPTGVGAEAAAERMNTIAPLSWQISSATLYPEVNIVGFTFTGSGANLTGTGNLLSVLIANNYVPIWWG